MTENIPSKALWTKDFILAFISNLIVFFSFYLLVPILPFYVIEELGATDSLAGVVLSLYTVSALMIRPFSGFMVDMFARKPLYLICYAVFTAVFAGYLVSGALTLFIILRIVHGVAFGINTVSGSTIAIDIMPSHRRGEGIGYFGMAASIAMALGPMTALFLYNSYTFQVIFAISFGVSILGLISVFFIKAPQKIIAPHKEPMSLDRFILLKGLKGAAVSTSIGIGYGIIMNYIGLYGQELGMGAASGLFFTLQAGGIVAARILSGKLINKGHLNSVIYIGAVLLVIGFSILAVKGNSSTFYVCAVILGLGYGYITPAFQTMFINLAEHNRRGTANSMYYTAWDLGIGTGTALGGAVIQYAGFSGVFTLCLAAVCGSMVYFWRVAAPYFTANKLR